MSQALKDRVAEAFALGFGGPPALIVRAPGRVNLIGEHTDYNDGFVLPCAIGVETQVAARPRLDGQVRVVAADFDMARDAFGLDGPIPRHPALGWANYVRGMVETLRLAGWSLSGADLALAGDIPQGAGLSSSASLEVAVGQAFKALAGLDGASPIDLARLAQTAECDFVGCRCGIMDQLASACGVEGHALLIDCRDLSLRPTPLRPDLAVMIVHSGVSRGLVDGAYNERRAQCEAAARHFGVAALRDLDLVRLERAGGDLDPVAYRRARHVISENQRVLDAAKALANGDLGRLGALMAASHASMRDDFEITVPAMDTLVEILQRAIGDQGGARMTGGGFGGAAVAVLARDRLDAVRAAVLAAYRTPAGAAPLILVETPTAGAGQLEPLGSDGII